MSSQFVGRISAALFVSLFAAGCAVSAEGEPTANDEKVDSVSSALEPALQWVDVQGSVAGFGSGTVNSTCPAGTVLTGGGFINNSGMLLDATRPTLSNTGWSTTAYNSTGGSLLLTSEAICLTHGSASASTVSTSGTIAANTATCVTTNCPFGTRVTGGGFQQNFTGPRVYSSTRLNNGWMTCTQNDSPNVGTLTTFARCLTLSGASVTTVTSSAVSVAPGTTGTVDAVCPSGTRVAGNGYFIPGGDWRVIRSDSHTSFSRLQAKNNTGTAGNIQAIATCLSVP